MLIQVRINKIDDFGAITAYKIKFKNGQKITNKKYFGFFFVSYISIQKKKCPSEQFLQGRPRGGGGSVQISFKKLKSDKI